MYLESAFFKRTESGAESGAEFGPGFGAEFGAEFGPGFGAGSSAFGAESGAGFGARSGAESDAEFGTKCSDFLSIPLSKYTKTWLKLSKNDCKIAFRHRIKKLTAKENDRYPTSYQEGNNSKAPEPNERVCENTRKHDFLNHVFR